MLFGVDKPSRKVKRILELEKAVMRYYLNLLYAFVVLAIISYVYPFNSLWLQQAIGLWFGILFVEVGLFPLIMTLTYPDNFYFVIATNLKTTTIDARTFVARGLQVCCMLLGLVIIHYSI